MFTIHLFSLHIEIRRRSKKENLHTLTQALQFHQVEREIEANRIKYMSAPRLY